MGAPVVVQPPWYRPIPSLVDASLTARTTGVVEAYDDRVSHKSNRVARCGSETQSELDDRCVFYPRKYQPKAFHVGSIILYDEEMGRRKE
ncbi:hypothetical protein BHE74_00059654 [Ensete ventricosum]|nr:hypothetical protein BHE74_00059654 [Ensete ventricosum]